MSFLDKLKEKLPFAIGGDDTATMAPVSQELTPTDEAKKTNSFSFGDLLQKIKGAKKDKPA